MDPTLRPRIIATLKDEITRFAPQLRTAAKYVIDHPSEFGLDPIRETARKAQVSTYTLVNMAKHLGFAGYEEFRAPFREALLASSPAPANPTWLDDLRERGAPGTALADATHNALAIVQRSLEHQQLEEMEAVVDMLLAADRVYLTAVRSSYAMAYYLHYVGRMALPSLTLIPRNMNSAIDDLNEATPGDVLIAITITPYSRETIQACEFARDKGLKLLLISDSEVVSPELDPEHTLVASVLSSHHFACFSGMTALIETLIAMLMHRGESAARERIDSYEKLRHENNAYWAAHKT
jgi:DNA-binding MurR/RpiR family transcriptional regulator